MWITDAARQAGVNVQTVRFYERRGLLGAASRSEAGYRQFTAETVKLLRFIKRAQSLGFSLDEVRALLELRQAPRSGRARAKRMADEKIADIDRKLADLQRMRDALATLSRSCAHSGRPDCPSLEAMEGA